MRGPLNRGPLKVSRIILKFHIKCLKWLSALLNAVCSYGLRSFLAARPKRAIFSEFRDVVFEDAVFDDNRRCLVLYLDFT